MSVNKSTKAPKPVHSCVLLLPAAPRAASCEQIPLLYFYPLIELCYAHHQEPDAVRSNPQRQAALHHHSRRGGQSRCALVVLQQLHFPREASARLGSDIQLHRGSTRRPQASHREAGQGVQSCQDTSRPVHVLQQPEGSYRILAHTRAELHVAEGSQGQRESSVRALRHMQEAVLQLLVQDLMTLAARPRGALHGSAAITPSSNLLHHTTLSQHLSLRVLRSGLQESGGAGRVRTAT
jgi:hypothetical protein